MRDQSALIPSIGIRRALLPLAVVAGVFLGLSARSGFTLERYGSLSSESLLLLHQRTSRIVESKSFAACQGWLLPALVPLSW